MLCGEEGVRLESVGMEGIVLRQESTDHVAGSCLVVRKTRRRTSSFRHNFFFLKELSAQLGIGWGYLRSARNIVDKNLHSRPRDVWGHRTGTNIKVLA